MEGAPESVISTTSCTFGALKANAVISNHRMYLKEIQSEIATLFHILVHHGPNTGQIVMEFAVYIVYIISKRMDRCQRPLSRLLLAL